MWFAYTGLLLATLTTNGAGSADPERYEIDRNHSHVGFSVRHMLVATVRGSFNSFSGHIMLDTTDITRSTADVTIEATSIDTNVERRDNHLRSADFFEVEKYPTIKFVGRRVEKNGEELALVGDLTIRDITKEVRIPFEMAGPITNSQNGRRRIGIDGQLRVKRQDFGIMWNRAIEGGGVVGDDVRIDLNIEANTAEQPRS